ncbi:MAG TPA: ABC transporter ATP-binding protein [Pseudonocardiaceae bacterium]|jgi:ABC-2 type transport system ATP-binding protein|nr:ABC transporter ATP-binding protein [Pseudonocardiaceae bacterium]
MTITDSRLDAGTTILRATGLTKRYSSGVLAVDGVDLAVHRGEVYGFLGPNGAGKTTTMRMLLGLIRPTSGTVDLLGEPPGAPAGLARVGALVESPGFYPYLSGLDNLRILARYRGVPRSQIDAMLDAVDLSDRAGDRFATYSLGMKQRLGVASALLGDPELLVLDEPTNGLDPAGMADMRTLVRRLGAEGRAVLLSSHLLGEVQQVCDRVGVISGGRLISESTVAELRGRAALVVAATPLDVAARRAVQLLGADQVQVVGAGLRLTAGEDEAAEINRELVAAGVEVSELRREERSLEEVFLEMTTRKGSDNDDRQATARVG